MTPVTWFGSKESGFLGIFIPVSEQRQKRCWCYLLFGRNNQSLQIEWRLWFSVVSLETPRCVFKLMIGISFSLWFTNNNIFYLRVWKINYFYIILKAEQKTDEKSFKVPKQNHSDTYASFWTMVRGMKKNTIKVIVYRFDPVQHPIPWPMTIKFSFLVWQQSDFFFSMAGFSGLKFHRTA